MHTQAPLLHSQYQHVFSSALSGRHTAMKTIPVTSKVTVLDIHFLIMFPLNKRSRLGMDRTNDPNDRASIFSLCTISQWYVFLYVTICLFRELRRGRRVVRLENWSSRATCPRGAVRAVRREYSDQTVPSPSNTVVKNSSSRRSY
jgi:hypothetical protein